MFYLLIYEYCYYFVIIFYLLVKIELITDYKLNGRAECRRHRVL